MKDILEYKNKRQESRTQALDRMAQASQDAGIYDKFI